jgi:two-component system, OmpR family, phosphate regulon response regulator PhoB
MANTNRIATMAQKVVIVNGNAELLGMLETVLDAGRYDMVFVESADHAYSNIKKLQPNLVIICTSIDDLAGFQLLTMLKLDAETRDVPVLTYTSEGEGVESDDEMTQIPDDEDVLRPAAPALLMN